MATILITGGTGQVGKQLCKRLLEKGYGVSVLSRTRKPYATIKGYTWDWNRQEIEKEALCTADYIIHLAGANIAAKRWTPGRKQRIVDSRVETGKLLLNTLKEQSIKPKAFITASAIGYYGTTTTDTLFTEIDPAANDFLGNTCNQWELMANGFNELDIRTVKIRTGVVLTKQGGALSKMIAPIKIGIGSASGTGKQYFHWIHIDDLCDIYLKAIEDTDMKGVYNAVAPEHITNYEFNKSLAEVLHKPFWFPKVPEIVLKLIFGEMSELLLKGSRVSSKKISIAGYNFKYPLLKDALKNLIKKEN